MCLNNYGASLLARGQNQEAVVVLRDSLAIMNSALQSGSETSVSLPTNVSVSDKLHYATKCMADRPKRKRSHSNDNELYVIRYSGEFAMRLDETTYNQSITIDDFDHHTEADKDHVRTCMDIHTAIIVYNTAMARQQLATSSKASARKREVVNKACIRLLRWAYAILSRSLHMQPREATQLSVLILGRLSELLNQAGQSGEAIKVALARQSMQDTVLAYETIVPSRPDTAAAA